MTKEELLVKLNEIWKDVLESEEDLNEDLTFFELGGNSMLATVMLENVNDELSLEIELPTLYEANTINLLADYILTVINK